MEKGERRKEKGEKKKESIGEKKHSRNKGVSHVRRTRKKGKEKK